MSRVFCTLTVVAAMVGGCAHKQETKAEAPKAEPAPPPQAAAAPPADTGAKTCASDLDCGAKQLCLNNRCVDITPDLAECTNVRVHFPFNSDEIDAADKPQLDRSARCLKADHSLHVTIEGNADERGTEEYNMALGDRRARSVAGYLQSLGASQAQVATVSYGKENPECQEHDEACWARNRRAALKAGSAGKTKK
ncbi:MAG TPA: peptidoglycan-associated lipoprotein Pal [Polyangia bacterium]